MPERFSSDEAVRALLAAGFQLRSTKGSHMKFRNSAGRTVIVPAGRRPLPIGTFHSILKQAQLTIGEAKKLLGRP
jgi:predicted RNA binding protein YcfA (HicA-like mRNA interferase family)